MIWHTKKFEELTLSELYGILNLRNEVFVVEQNCVYLDTDHLDQQSFHIFLEYEGRIIAYARAMDVGVRFEHISFGRVIVAKDFRDQKLGKTLIQQTLDCIEKYIGHTPIEIHGQSYLIKFYESFGFKIVGEEFLEDDIPHFRMIRTLV